MSIGADQPCLKPDLKSCLTIGLMSGTSLDGVDGVLARFDASNGAAILASSHLPFPTELRCELLALQTPGDNEIHREASAAIALVHCYAAVVAQLLQQAKLTAAQITAIGAHGQTIRHRPELGYTRQLNHPALLAELSCIDVIADFRSRDVAAGGQGAPLVPAFHQAFFDQPATTQVVLNLGGMANISILPAAASGAPVTGFDTGPGNVLLDSWIMRQRQLPFDADGAFAASGQVLPELLTTLRSTRYFALKPPKSTGRDLFDAGWLDAQLGPFLDAYPDTKPADIQATLAELSASTIAAAIATYATNANEVYVCGGGAYNGDLLRRLSDQLLQHGVNAEVALSTARGVAPDQVEALAFAWLAWRFCCRLPGNLVAVTGAAGARILGALYPA